MEVQGGTCLQFDRSPSAYDAKTCSTARLADVRLPARSQVVGQTGIGALALRLNHILVEHIRALLPSLRAHLEEALERRQKELKKYGAMPPGSTSAARWAPRSSGLVCNGLLYLKAQFLTADGDRAVLLLTSCERVHQALITPVWTCSMPLCIMRS